jgi:tRNA1Val (adenine37-N6)-methyltransferase
MSKRQNAAAVFRFKQFEINQAGAAMKVGTDGVLLGAWAGLGHRPETILDIGSGTGLIALMLAQRFDAEQIDGVEIEGQAFEACSENFEISPWSDRLFCYHASLQEFATEFGPEYDLIVSNPPYFAEGIQDLETARSQARKQCALPFTELLSGVNKLLTSKGRFELILPFREEVAFIEAAATYDLFPRQIMRVRGNEQVEVKRSLLSFSRIPEAIQQSLLTIEKSRHQYTEDYINLTREFYLKM